MKKFVGPMSVSIACIPFGIILALIGVKTEVAALPIIGNILTYGGILSLVVILVRRRKVAPEESIATVTEAGGCPSMGTRLWTYTILVISIVSLPFTVFLGIAHPEGTHVPPSLIALPVGMIGVGLQRRFGSQVVRRILRWLALILFTVALVGLGAMLFIESRVNPRGFQIGEDPGQYAPQNIITFLFLPLLFLYASPSEKIHRLSSSVVWFGFSVALLFLCAIIGIGVSSLLHH